MCKLSNTRATRKVVISGAGPAGLLCASLLLARNKESDATITYDVTLIDGRQDFGSLTKEELSKSFRSWMLALANHGCDALREVPTLYEEYVNGTGVKVEELNIYLGKKRITQTADEGEDIPEAFIVDRNFVVAAIARYMKDNHEKDDSFTPLYETNCMMVDYKNKQVLVRNNKTQEETYVPYDLLIGCDGVRSTVREALIKKHSNFACEIKDIFQEFKAVHVRRPKALSSKGMSLLPDIFKGFQGIALPETGDLVNISMGAPRHLFHSGGIDDELKSDDYKVVSKYIKENFKPFELEDYDDFAKQWVNQRWNQTGMVHCNFYHSCESGIVIMGDAAHATSPSIGMGMNTALRDAQVFNNLLKEHKDDLSKVLPSFSEARVKEGNSLTNLAYYLYSMDKTQQTLETLHMVIRSSLHKKFPRLVSDHPANMIGVRGVSLSEVYDQATKLNIIPKHRAMNDKVRNSYFEKSTGMVQDGSGKSSATSTIIGVGAVIASIMIGYLHVQN